MKLLYISVADKVATYQKREGDIICGNSNYKIKFTFDSEWEIYAEKTARFVWNGRYYDVDFTGDTCSVPLITGTDSVKVGVYAGDLKTTTPAVIGCRRSILCESTTPTPETEHNYVNEAKEAADRAEAAAERAESAEGGKGTKIVSTELIGQDAEGGNIYRQTFSDGTTATFTAPKGSTGNTGAKIISTVLVGQDANGGNVYRQTFDNGTTATFTAPKGEKGAKGDKGDKGEKGESGGGGSLPRYVELLISGGAFESEGWFVEEWGENVWRITPDYITPPTLTANSKIDLVTHPSAIMQLLNEGCTLQAVNNNGSWEIYALGAYPPMLDDSLMAVITEVQQ